MSLVRQIVAAAAVTAILALGATVALAAPGSISNAASPKASAARAAYCPPEEKKRRQAELQAFRRQMLAARKAYFKTHPSAKARAAFVKAQNKTLNQLVRAFARCD